MDVPVVIFGFNRPAKSASVLHKVREVKPKHLFLIADGPRPNIGTDLESCEQVRRLADMVDWPCIMATNYAETNMGLRSRLSSGISWVFEHVDRAIFLEDDCVPDPSFFPYCEQLLELYRNHDQVMHIGGFNPLSSFERDGRDYHFSRFALVWGWASWRRAWQYYDVELKKWESLAEQDWLSTIMDHPWFDVYFGSAFDAVISRSLQTWAFQWQFACWQQRGLSVIPRVNLIRNVGFGAMATNTTSRSSMSAVGTHQLRGSLSPPSELIWDDELDKLLFHRVHCDRYKYETLRFWKDLRENGRSAAMRQWMRLLSCAPHQPGTWRAGYHALLGR